MCMGPWTRESKRALLGYRLGRAGCHPDLGSLLGSLPVRGPLLSVIYTSVWVSVPPGGPTGNKVQVIPIGEKHEFLIWTRVRFGKEMHAGWVVWVPV